jgi:hypothetical protein
MRIRLLGLDALKEALEREGGTRPQLSQQLASIDKGQQGSDRHHARDSDAVSGAKIVRGLEAQNEQDDRNHQRSIDTRHIDLPDLAR